MNHFIQQAVHYMQLKHYAKALKVCDDILASDYNHPQIHMIKAIALGKTGQLDSSQDIFNALLDSFPLNPEIYYNFALILQDNNKIKEALAHYNKCLQLNPQHSSALCNAGVIELNQSNSRAAHDYFKQALNLQPSNSEYLKNYAHSLFQLNNFRGAQDILINFIDSEQFSADDMVILLECLYKNRENTKALFVSEKALKLYPKKAKILNIVCLLELDNKKYKRAMSLSSLAIELEPNNINFKINHLTALSYTEPRSQQAFRQLKTLVKSHKESEKVYIFATTLCETQGNFNKAKKFLRKGLKNNPKCANLWLLKAKIFKQLKHPEKALKALNKAQHYCQDMKLESQIFYEKAHNFDKLRKYLKAWKAIKKANSNNKELTTYNSLDNQFISQSSELYTHIKQITTQALEAELEHPKLIFIIGFPRSGTTLLEKILNALPHTQVLEETNAINEIYTHLFHGNYNNYLKKLSALSNKEIIKLQNSYFESISDYFDWNGKDTIIDKMPMNSNHLALIQKIFPNAKILFVVRHPIDVCLSCLMQDMLQVFSIAEAAQVYHAYMKVYDLYKNKLTLNLYEIKYEELITDFESEIKKVLEFLNMEWHPQITTFYQSKKMVNTPSYQQVNQPIYRQSAYRYKNYLSNFIDEIKPLEKWIQHYNYET